MTEENSIGSDEDLKCAIWCGEKGILPALAVTSGDDYRFTTEKGNLNKDPRSTRST